jgi:hypothetical protein
MAVWLLGGILCWGVWAYSSGNFRILDVLIQWSRPWKQFGEIPPSQGINCTYLSTPAAQTAVIYTHVDGVELALARVPALKSKTTHSSISPSPHRSRPFKLYNPPERLFRFADLSTKFVRSSQLQPCFRVVPS